MNNQNPTSYSENILQALTNPYSQVEILPGLLLAQLFSFPINSVEFFFFAIYHFVCGIFMYFFIYRYFSLVIGSEEISVRLRIATSLAGSLLFMYFPYNILGDNFPELFFMRSLIPLFLLLLMEFMESGKAVLFAISTVTLSYMTILDPRAIIIVPVLAFFFLVVPKIMVSVHKLSKTIILLSFAFCVLLSFVISNFTITPRITDIQVPTAIGVPFVREAFRYSFANMLNTFGGLSFEGTFQTVSYLPFNLAYYLPIIGLFTAIVAFSVFLTIKLRGRKLAIYAFIPAVFVLAVLVFFVNFDGYPLFQKLLFSTPSSHLPSSLKTVALLFRTPRLTNIALALFYSTFSSVSIVSFIKFLKVKEYALRFFTQNGYQIIAIHKKKFLSIVLVILLLVSVISSVLIFSTSGNVFGDFAGERANAYVEVNRIYENRIGASMITVPYVPTLWDFPQAPVGLSESVMRYIYAYTLDPSLPTSLISRNQTSQIGGVLSMAGVKYIIVDEYVGKQERVLDIVNHSSSFRYTGQVGQLYVFEVNNFENFRLADPIFVMGGYETYFQTIEALKSLSINSYFSPIFMDGPTSWETNNFPSFGAILSSPNKSLLDLICPLMMSEKNATVLPLSQFTSAFDPPNYWSPAFVSDTHQGVWTNFLGTMVGYDWDYSYSPSYGFVFTWGPDTLVADFSVSQTASYSVFARSLHHPGNGTLKVELDSNRTQLNTGWNSSSSEFVWDILGDVNLTRGSHTLSITNEEGLNAINLVVFIPTEKVKQLVLVAEQSYRYTGDVKLLSPAIINNASTVKNVTYNVNVLQEGSYSALIRINVQGQYDNSVKLVINNTTYQTQIMSLDPYIVCAENIVLHAGNQSVELISSQGFSNATAIVYGPEGSLADKMLSGYSDKSQVEADNLSINRISSSYYEPSISFNANASFMIVLPQLYTGTMKVSFDNQTSRILYSTYPILNVFTGIWVKMPNGTSSESFVATFYTDEGRGFKESTDSFVFIVGTVFIAAVCIDLLVMLIKHKKNKQLRNLLGINWY